MGKEGTKLTISIPADLIKMTDNIAKSKKISRSKLVAMCLRELAEKHLHEEMEEGYKAMAEEQRATADLSFEAQKEIIPKW